MTTAKAPPERPAGAPGEAVERKGERTRRRILHAAREVFARVGYERATIRCIAETAEVDKSSVVQYFGTKEGLFREAVHWDIPIATLTTEDPTETVEKRIRGMLSAWAAHPDSPMAVLVRTSMTSDYAADVLRNHITAQFVDATAATLTAPDARLRAAIGAAFMMGIVSQRHILEMPDLASAGVEDVVRLVVPLMRTLLYPDDDQSR